MENGYPEGRAGKPCPLYLEAACLRQVTKPSPQAFRRMLFHQKLTHKSSVGEAQAQCFFSYSFLCATISGHESFRDPCVLSSTPEQAVQCSREGSWTEPRLPGANAGGSEVPSSRCTPERPREGHAAPLPSDTYLALPRRQRKREQKANRTPGFSRPPKPQ